MGEESLRRGGRIYGRELVHHAIGKSPTEQFGRSARSGGDEDRQPGAQIANLRGQRKQRHPFAHAGAVQPHNGALAPQDAWPAQPFAQP